MFALANLVGRSSQARNVVGIKQNSTLVGAHPFTLQYASENSFKLLQHIRSLLPD
jgi:hypothetical protein